METTIIDNDIKVFYVTAASFPDGIMDAYNKLRSLIPYSAERKYFGVSRPENGVIVYRAAAEEMNEGEGEKLHCDTLVLKKGAYISLTVYDYMQDIPGIGRAFTQLLSHPNIDPEGYCVEWYVNDKDVKCMIRSKEQ